MPSRKGIGKSVVGAPVRARIDCARRKAVEVLGRADALLRRAKSLKRRPIIDLAHLERVDDSATRVLKELAWRIVEHPRPVVIRDRSGLAETFLSAIAQRAPIRKE